jgi:hypothetical protein
MAELSVAARTRLAQTGWWAEQPASAWGLMCGKKTTLATEDRIATMNKIIGAAAGGLPHPVISAPDGGRSVPMQALAPSTTGRMLAASADTGGALTVLETVKEPGDVGPPRHRHPAVAEMFYVLEGEMTFLVEDEVIQAPRGACLVVPGRSIWSSSALTGTPDYSASLPAHSRSACGARAQSLCCVCPLLATRPPRRQSWSLWMDRHEPTTGWRSRRYRLPRRYAH